MDVHLFNNEDGGEIEVIYDTAGYFNVVLSAGLETAVYLSLFGGNGWWGNIGEQPARQYNSKTEALIAGGALNSGSLQRLDEAVKADLQWMISSGAATSLAVSTAIVGVNRVQIIIVVSGRDNITFVENWVYDTNN